MNSTDVKNLKAKIKAEMQRRNGVGSLTEYAGSSYNFSTVPAANVKTFAEHGQKTIDLVLKIEDFKDLKLVKKGEPIPKAFGSLLSNEIDRLASEQKTGDLNEKSSCRGACTGLCVGSCIGFCNGCSGCTATCGTGCASGCRW